MVLLKEDFGEKMFEWVFISSSFNIFNINVNREYREFLEKCVVIILSLKFVVY